MNRKFDVIVDPYFPLAEMKRLVLKQVASLAKRLAEEKEAKRLAEEAEAKKLAEEQKAKTKTKKKS